RSGSTAMTRARPSSAVTIPETNPPPPTPTTTVSRPGTSSSSSRASVPCPATTPGSECGWMKTRPCCSTTSSVRSYEAAGSRAAPFHCAAVAPRRPHLAWAPASPHLTEAVDFRFPGRPCARLCGVAGRPRDNAPPPLFGRQRRDAVERAAHLERARLLEQLGLERDAEGARAEGGRAVDPSGEDGAGLLDVFS